MSFDISIPSRQRAVHCLSKAVFCDGASHYVLLVVLLGIGFFGRQSPLLDDLPYFWLTPLMIVTGATGSFRPLLFGYMLSILGAAYTADIETNAELRDLLVSIATASLCLSGIGFVISYQGRRVAEAQAQARVAEHMQQELNHRIKNLFSVVIALIRKRSRLAQKAENADPCSPFDDLIQSIAALGRAHGIGHGQIFGERFDLDLLMHEIMSPYASHWRTDQPAPIQIAGPSVALPTRMLSPLALLLHELATNAVKYGALSSQSGKIEVTWNVFNDNRGLQFISICWTEKTKPGVQQIHDEGNQGYGTRIIDAAAAQLDARIVRDFRQDGLRLSVTLPIIGNAGS